MKRSSREELETYADKGFKIPDKWEQEKLAIAEGRRIARITLMSAVAIETPRRLGEDASGRDLSDDKRLSRGIAHTYLGLWTRLTTSSNAPLPAEELDEDLLPPDDLRHAYRRALLDDDLRRLGATVIWEDWWEDLRPKLIGRRIGIASFALDRGLMKWGYRLVLGISNELDWIDKKIKGNK